MQLLQAKLCVCVFVCMCVSSECLILMRADTAHAAPDAAIASKSVCVCTYVCMYVCMCVSSECLILMRADTANAASDATIASKT